MLKANDIIYMIEKNNRGAWVVYGILGVKQYYDYTKMQAREKYIDEARATVFVNEGR